MPSSNRTLASALCWLLAILAAAAGQASALQASNTQSNEHGPLPDIMMISGRLSVQAPKHALRLGEQNAFDIDLKGPALRDLFVDQAQPDGFGNFVLMSDDKGQQPVVQHRRDGTTYVNVVPIGLGTIQFGFFADFVDGGFERVDVTGQVVAAQSARKLKSEQTLQGKSGRTDMWMAVGQQKVLWLEAEFDGVPQPIVVKAKDIQFTVRQTRGQPAIHFDPATGAITSLRLGDALIESAYAGAKHSTCVMVREHDGYSQGECDELEPGANRELPTEKDADAAGADRGSKLPYTADDGRQGRFSADDRVEFAAPAHPFYVAEENAITMKVQGGSVVRVDCKTQGGAYACVPRDGYEKPTPSYTFVSQANGDVVVHLFPSTLDEVQYKFAVLFADGGAAHKALKVRAELGTKQPRAINKSCGHDSYENENLPRYLGAPAKGQPAAPTNDLWSSACYDGIPGFVIIPPKLVTFKVWSDEGDGPVIRMDAEGQVIPLRAGQALLEREFRGLKSETCFVVRATDQRIEDLSNCRGLRAKHAAPLPELPPEARQQQVIESAALLPEVKDRFGADERLQIPLEGVSLRFGEPGKLTVHLTGPGELQTAVYQQLLQYSVANESTPFEDRETDESRQLGMVLEAPDGSAFVNLVPQRMGKAKFRIDVLFADGGVASRSFEIAVKPPAKPPVQFINSIDGTHTDIFMAATTLHLLLTAPHNVRKLFPVAQMEENQPLILLGANDVKLEVKQPDEPVIRLDPADGEVTGLRLGHALIKMSFAGAVSKTCVVVMDDMTKGDPSNCEELR
jgi:hypothetical protein